jgi:putative ATP-binding cassette transporter
MSFPSFLLDPSARPRLIVALVVSLLGGLAGGAAVAVVNRALTAGPSALPVLGLWFGGLSLCMWLCRSWSHAYFVRFSQQVLVRLRLHVSAHFAAAPYREIEALGSAQMLAVLVEDVRTVAEVFVTLPRLSMQAAVVVGGLSYLAVLSWSAFAFAVGLIVTGSLGHVALEKRAAVHLRRARRSEDDLYEHLRGLVAGAKELKLNAARQEAFLGEVLSRSVDELRLQRMRGLRMHVVAGSFGAFLFFALIGGVVFLSAVLGGDAEVRSGYALTLLFLMHPIEGLVEMIPALSQARIALERIVGVGAGRAPLPALPGAELAAAPLTGLSLVEVTHRYRRDDDDGVFVLGPVSLELRPAETVFLIGGNGSGKTTLAKLLVGLYQPETGHVSLNGEVVGSSGFDEYRQRFSAIFSDFHLFRELLASDQRVIDRSRELLTKFGLSQRVSVEGACFSTTDLSRGQQKRLALVALLLEDRPVCVFDEWAADQDPAYKDRFYCEVLPELRAQGKSVLVISHDERYFHLADRCIELEAGQIVRSYVPSAEALAAS